MNYVFLILIFSNRPAGTVNITTPMPSMEVCERMLDYHMDDLPMSGTWTTSEISKPSQGYCKEIIVADKPEVK